MVSTMSDGWKFEQVMNGGPWESSDHRDHSLVLILPTFFVAVSNASPSLEAVLCHVQHLLCVCSDQFPSVPCPHTHTPGAGWSLPSRGLLGLMGCVCVCVLCPDPVRITSKDWAGADVTMVEPAPHVPDMWPKKGCTLKSSCHSFWNCELGCLICSQAPFALLSCDFWLEESPPITNLKTLSSAVLDDPRPIAQALLFPSFLTFVQSPWGPPCYQFFLVTPREPESCWLGRNTASLRQG